MESTLSLKVSDLQAEVGSFLGWGRGAAFGDPTWSAQQQARIDSAVTSGLRQFYFPPPLEGAASSYDWSFLKPVATLSLALGAKTVPLPDDFGGFEGQISIGSTAGQSYWPIDLVGVGMVYNQQSKLPTTTGRPTMCCQEPLKGTGPLSGQRAQLHFWPTADTAYAIVFQYYLLADALTIASPYAYGGAAHAETVLESCLAVAEERQDDARTVHSQKFMERLAASISWDKKSKPQKLGYNDDRSDWRSPDRREWAGWPSISYRGVVY